MQFTKELFQEIVVLWNHAAPYHDPKTGKEAHFITMGPLSSKDTLFPGVTRDLELYTTEEVMSLRSTGILKSPSGASLSLYKLSSLTSLAQIQSIPTTHKVTPGSPKVELDSSSKRQDYTSYLKSQKHLVSVAAGSSASLERSYEWDCDAECRWYEDKGHDKNCERSRERKSSHLKCASGHDHGGASKHGRSAESGSSLVCHHSKEQRLHSQSRSCDHKYRCPCTPECVHLLPPRTFHSTPINLHHMSANSNAGLWSFNMSQGSLLPADSGSCEIEMFVPLIGVVTPMSVNQLVSSSVLPTTMQLDAATTMAGLSKEQAEEIFLLTCEAQKLGRKITHDFINLSSQEVHFLMGIQATGYEKVASGCPDCVTAYYTMIHSEGVEAEKLNEAFDHLCQEACQAWFDTNSILFHHTLEYQNKLSNFLKEIEDAIEALHERIWTVIVKVMEDAGKPMANGLAIAMCLVDMLIHLAFHPSTPGLTGFVPEVYAAWPRSRMDVLDFSHMPPLQSDQKVLDILHEEIIKNMGGASKMAKAVQPAVCFAVVDLSTIGAKAYEVGAGDGPTSSPCALHSLGWHSWTWSQSPWHHSQSS